MHAGLRGGGSARARELARAAASDGERGARRPRAVAAGARRGRPSRRSRRTAASCVLRGAARAHEVRVVGVREPVRPRAEPGEHGALLEREHGVARAGGARAAPRSRRGPSRRRRRAGRGRATPSGDALGRGDAPQELGAVGRRRPQLEVRRARARQRAAAEQRAAQVGGAAARPRDDAPRRPLERRAAGVEHAGLAQHLERPRVAADVQLVARRAVEGAAAVRADLGLRRRARAAARTPAGPRPGLARSRWSAISPRPRRCTAPAEWKSAESSASRSQPRSGRDRRRARCAAPRRAARPRPRARAAAACSSTPSAP